MDKKPSERQKKCKNSFPYMGKEMNKTYCRKLMQERRDADEDDMSVCVSNEQCENCPDYESRFIEYPIQVNSIKCDKMKQLMMGRAGSLVKIRPCNECQAMLGIGNLLMLDGKYTSAELMFERILIRFSSDIGEEEMYCIKMASEKLIALYGDLDFDSEEYKRIAEFAAFL